jgi:hypothetical protein
VIAPDVDTSVQLVFSRRSVVQFSSQRELPGSLSYHFYNLDTTTAQNIITHSRSSPLTFKNLSVYADTTQDERLFLDYADEYTESPVVRTGDSLFIESDELEMIDHLILDNKRIYVSCSGKTDNVIKEDFQLVDDTLTRFPKYKTAIIFILVYAFNVLIVLYNAFIKAEK